MKQLKAGECFAEFIIKTVNRVYDKNIEPQIRKIAIREYKIKSKAKYSQVQKGVKYDKNNFYTFQDGKFWLKKYLI